ncbi:unnamed protein product [Adineta steineri]|uniref:Uncharacterized protein n=1 Tax=Adineta steineri TaxID=433720 RepID=A0A815FE85_9BILA|nr:unnamed protein product [Adineta steineri]CAF1323960.1 unnamed protein product [Adineta steineri]CAF3520869.1 unnamed protein product [Adineta steineri]CAF3695059.1 unnamed protein product [Adineta steineri]
MDTVIVIHHKRPETAPFPFRQDYIYKSGYTHYSVKRRKTIFVHGRFLPETAFGITALGYPHGSSHVRGSSTYDNGSSSDAPDDRST